MCRPAARATLEPSFVTVLSPTVCSDYSDYSDYHCIGCRPSSFCRRHVHSGTGLHNLAPDTLSLLCVSLDDLFRQRASVLYNMQKLQQHFIK